MSLSDIQLRLYKAIMLVGAVLSAACIIGNYFAAFPFQADLKWIALFLITIFAFAFSNDRKSIHHIMFGVFIFLICIFLPFAFVDSGGSNNNALGYVFLLLIVTTYLFKGWRRIFLISALIVVFISMHALEYFCPDIIAEYTRQAQFIDRMIQIPFILLVSFLIILRFTKEYELVNHKLDVLAKYDELTGLYNRRMFDKAIDSAFEEKNKEVFLAFLDLNNFKKVNDKCGHSTGDEVLKELSGLLQKTFESDKDIVSRWGGDEFAIIYYGDKDDLDRKLEYIKKAFSTFVSTYEKTAGISTSIVSFNDFDTISQMVNAADKQLYKQKQDNREQIASPCR